MWNIANTAYGIKRRTCTKQDAYSTYSSQNQDNLSANCYTHFPVSISKPHRGCCCCCRCFCCCTIVSRSVASRASSGLVLIPCTKRGYNLLSSHCACWREFQSTRHNVDVRTCKKYEFRTARQISYISRTHTKRFQSHTSRNFTYSSSAFCIIIIRDSHNPHVDYATTPSQVCGEIYPEAKTACASDFV